jgi:hypothetical protein
MKNMREVREQLTRVFDGLMNGSIGPQAATEMNNAAGKIINTLKIELAYHALRRESPTIEFLEGNQTVPMTPRLPALTSCEDEDEKDGGQS